MRRALEPSAAIYVRVSTPEQEKGFSLQGQVSECRAYCERQKYRVARILQDVDSGRDFERPAFQRLVTLALQGAFDVIVVWRRDRLGRGALEMGFFERVLRQGRVRIEAIQQGPREVSPYNDFLDRVIDAVDELEARRIIERCRLGREAAVRAGQWPSKPPPGYTKNDNGQLTVDQAAAAHIRAGFEAYLAGMDTDDLSRLWGVSKAAAIKRLHQPAYCGRGTFAGVPIPTPEIIPPRMYDAAQALSQARKWNGHHATPPRRAGRPQRTPKPQIPA